MSVVLSNNKSYQRQFFKVPAETMYTIDFNGNHPNYYRLNNMSSITLYGATNNIPTDKLYDFKAAPYSVANFTEPAVRDKIYILNQSKTDANIILTTWADEFNPTFMAISEITLNADGEIKTDGIINQFNTSLPAGNNKIGIVDLNATLTAYLKNISDNSTKDTEFDYTSLLNGINSKIDTLATQQSAKYISDLLSVDIASLLSDIKATLRLIQSGSISYDPDNITPYSEIMTMIDNIWTDLNTGKSSYPYLTLKELRKIKSHTVIDEKINSYLLQYSVDGDETSKWYCIGQFIKGYELALTSEYINNLVANGIWAQIKIAYADGTTRTFYFDAETPGNAYEIAKSVKGDIVSAWFYTESTAPTPTLPIPNKIMQTTGDYITKEINITNLISGSKLSVTNQRTIIDLIKDSLTESEEFAGIVGVDIYNDESLNIELTGTAKAYYCNFSIPKTFEVYGESYNDETGTIICNEYRFHDMSGTLAEALTLDITSNSPLTKAILLYKVKKV